MKTADFARDTIATMERETKSHAARVTMAKAAISIGRYDDEAKKVWADYLAKLEQ